MPHVLDLDQITELTALFRTHLEPCWRQFHEDYANGVGRKGVPIPDPISSFTCRHTSAFILRRLVAAGVGDVAPAGGWMRHAYLPADKEITIEGNHEFDDAGFVWQPHFWLEHNGFIIDITKDQFGWDHSAITPIEEGQAIYRRLDQYSKSYWLKSLKMTVSKFEGHTFTRPQDANPHYEETRKRFAVLTEEIASCVTPALKFDTGM